MWNRNGCIAFCARFLDKALRRISARAGIEFQPVDMCGTFGAPTVSVCDEILSGKDSLRQVEPGILAAGQHCGPELERIVCVFI